jgi:hypothetical protein
MRICALLTVLICGLNSAVAQRTETDQTGLVRAQQTVDRFVDRLHQTLGFRSALEDFAVYTEDAALLSQTDQKQPGHGGFEDIENENGMFPWAIGIGAVDPKFATEISPQEIRRVRSGCQLPVASRGNAVGSSDKEERPHESRVAPRRGR